MFLRIPTWTLGSRPIGPGAQLGTAAFPVSRPRSSFAGHADQGSVEVYPEREKFMAKHTIGWLPGDGIGVDVLDAAKIVLDRLALDAEYVHGDIGWECWCAEGDPLPPRTADLLRTGGRGALRRDHVEAEQGGRSRAGARAARPEARLPLAHRAHASGVRPLRLPAPVPLVRRQPAQLQAPDRSGHLPREHRGPLLGRRVLAGARGALGRAEPAVEAVRRLREARRRRLRRVVQGEHAARLGAHHPRGVRVREEAPAAEGHDRPQGQRGARDRRAVPRHRARGGPGLPRPSRWTTRTSTPSRCGC